MMDAMSIFNGRDESAEEYGCGLADAGICTPVLSLGAVRGGGGGGMSAFGPTSALDVGARDGRGICVASG